MICVLCLCPQRGGGAGAGGGRGVCLLEAGAQTAAGEGEANEGNKRGGMCVGVY